MYLLLWWTGSQAIEAGKDKWARETTLMAAPKSLFILLNRRSRREAERKTTQGF